MGIPAVLVLTVLNFNVEPGPAKDVLYRWAVLAHVALLTDPAEFDGLELRGVHGKMDARAALRTILAGTDLTYTVHGDWNVGGNGMTDFVIHRIRPCAPLNSGEPMVLPPCAPSTATPKER